MLECPAPLGVPVFTGDVSTSPVNTVGARFIAPMGAMNGAPTGKGERLEEKAE